MRSRPPSFGGEFEGVPPSFALCPRVEAVEEVAKVFVVRSGRPAVTAAMAAPPQVYAPLLAAVPNVRTVARRLDGNAKIAAYDAS